MWARLFCAIDVSNFVISKVSNGSGYDTIGEIDHAWVVYGQKWDNRMRFLTTLAAMTTAVEAVFKRKAMR